MNNLRSTVARWLAVTVSCALALLAQSSAHATTATPYFTNLVSELQGRSTALTGTTNKLAKAQKKAIDAALKSISTAHGLALTDDLKLASTVTKGLAKSFASEFAPAGGPTPPGTHALGKLTSTLVSNLANEVTADLNDLDTQISALAEGSKKVAALKSAGVIHQKLTIAIGLTPIATEASALAIVETGLLSLAKAVLKTANSGGGGGTGGAGMHCKINGESFAAPAIGTVGVYYSQTGQLGITGGTTTKAVSIILANVTGPGDYSAVLCTVSQFTTDPQNSTNFVSNVSDATIHITAYTPGGSTASGTFSFTASQATPVPDANNIVTVTEGTFSTTHIVNLQF